jgi:hypothetical protein
VLRRSRRKTYGNQPRKADDTFPASGEPLTPRSHKYRCAGHLAAVQAGNRVPARGPPIAAAASPYEASGTTPTPAKLGFIADLISKPTMIGYMNGLALTILVGQLPKLFGFKAEAGGFIGEVTGFIEGLANGEAVAAAAAVGIAGIVVILVLQRSLPKVPAVLIMVVPAATVNSAALTSCAGRPCSGSRHPAARRWPRSCRCLMPDRSNAPAAR